MQFWYQRVKDYSEVEHVRLECRGLVPNREDYKACGMLRMKVPLWFLVGDVVFFSRLVPRHD